MSEVGSTPEPGPDLEQVLAERDRLLQLLQDIARTHHDVAATLSVLSDKAEYWWVDQLLPERDHGGHELPDSP